MTLQDLLKTKVKWVRGNRVYRDPKPTYEDIQASGGIEGDLTRSHFIDFIEIVEDWKNRFGGGTGVLDKAIKDKKDFLTAG